jgi:aminoglycoside phosphotransferase
VVAGEEDRAAAGTAGRRREQRRDENRVAPSASAAAPLAAGESPSSPAANQAHRNAVESGAEDRRRRQPEAPAPHGIVGRFAVPRDDPGVAAWFFGHLFVPHGRRERLVAAIARRAAGWGLAAAFPRTATRAALATEAAWSDAVAADDWLCDGPGRPLLDTAGLGSRAGGLLVADYAGSSRRRSLVFLFQRVNGSPPSAAATRRPPGASRDRGARPAPPADSRGIDAGAAPRDGRRSIHRLFAAGSSRPSAVAKVRPAAAIGSPLAAEREAIERVRTELPPDVAATIPAVLGWRRDAEWEALLLAALPGRSIWADLHAAWRPARRAERHLLAAADWLARFHAATRRDQPYRLPPWSRIAAAAEPDPPPWYHRLADRLARRPLHLAAGHGDFWARNVLLAGGEVSAVVDWEAARPAAPPFEDLFTFVWSYGLGFPWRGGGPLAAGEAFRRAFLDDNPLSRAIAAALGRYGAAQGLAGETVGDLFRLWLRTRPADGPEGGDTWRTSERRLGEAGHSVFSG